MKHRIMMGSLCLGCVAAFAAPAKEKPADKLVFRNSGFSISPLDEPGKGPTQVLMMFLPASGGFAPNVNVQTQEYSGKLEEYAALSKKQLEDSKLKLISSSVTSGALILEYSGEMQARALHWYAKAVLKSGTIYLTTATATENQWKEVSGKLKSCVDSFETIPTAPPGQTTRPS